MSSFPWVRARRHHFFVRWEFVDQESFFRERVILIPRIIADCRGIHDRPDFDRPADCTRRGGLTFDWIALVTFDRFEGA